MTTTHDSTGPPYSRGRKQTVLERLGVHKKFSIERKTEHHLDCSSLVLFSSLDVIQKWRRLLWPFVVCKIFSKPIGSDVAGLSFHGFDSSTFSISSSQWVCCFFVPCLVFSRLFHCVDKTYLSLSPAVLFPPDTFPEWQLELSLGFLTAPKTFCNHCLKNINNRTCAKIPKFQFLKTSLRKEMQWTDIDALWHPLGLSVTRKTPETSDGIWNFRMF